MIKHYLEKVIAGEDLTQQEASQVLDKIIAGDINETQAGALLTALRMKGESVDEIVGFVETMEKHMVKIDLEDTNAIDMCGTGGDGSQSFNVSTTAALVVAAGGVTVAKHGNRSISSKCGSADVIEKLGVKIDLSPAAVKQCIDKIGIGFLFAPLYHPAMKILAPVRKSLEIRTVFNMLGPLLNPAQVRRQLIGTFNVEAAQKLAKVLLARGYKKACTVHSGDGFDEVSPFAENQIFEVSQNNDSFRELKYAVRSNVRNKASQTVRGASSGENAKITLDILEGEKGATRDMTVTNAAFGFYVAEKVDTVEAGIELSEKVIDSGAALAKLIELRETSLSLVK